MKDKYLLKILLVASKKAKRWSTDCWRALFVKWKDCFLTQTLKKCQTYWSKWQSNIKKIVKKREEGGHFFFYFISTTSSSFILRLANVKKNDLIWTWPSGAWVVLVVPHLNLKLMGDRAFVIAAPDSGINCGIKCAGHSCVD